MSPSRDLSRYSLSLVFVPDINLVSDWTSLHQWIAGTAEQLAKRLVAASQGDRASRAAELAHRAKRITLVNIAFR